MVTGLNPFARWIARTFMARPSYFRIIASSYKGNITEHGKVTPIEGECLYEIMGFSSRRQLQTCLSTINRNRKNNLHLGLLKC
jgi:hypothetical protein